MLNPGWEYPLDYERAAREAGDTTFARSVSASAGIMFGPPPAANDNGLAERPRIVGLMGYGGAGKSTVANILRDDLGFKGPHIKGPLRAMCDALLTELGYDKAMRDRYLDGDLKRTAIPELRIDPTQLQQFQGTEFGREFCYPDLWLDLWLKKVDGILSAGGRVVQESVRFANEADSIRVRGGVIVLVTRPGVGPVNGHKSEEFPTDPDIILHNDGSLADLRARVREIAA